MNKNFQNTIEWNARWYRIGARINKYLYLIFQFSTVALPALLLYFNSREDFAFLVIPTILANILVSAFNITLKPFQAWQKFKQAEIRLAILLLQYNLAISACSSDPAREIKTTAKYIEILQALLLNIATEYFSEIEKSKKENIDVTAIEEKNVK